MKLFPVVILLLFSNLASAQKATIASDTDVISVTAPATITQLETQWNFWVSYADGKAYLNNVSPVFNNESFVNKRRPR